jgi:general secretion pathway protein B
MSYILEALKKAQAERQLGSAPTLHAPSLRTADTASPAARFSKPLLLSVVGMAALIGVLLVLVLRAPSAPAEVPTLATVAASPAPAPASALPIAQSAAPPAVAAVTPLPAPVADLPPSVANLARNSAPEARPQQQSQPTVAAAPAVAATPAKVATAPEEPVVNLRDLPEPIQRSIPPVTVGGYIYSKNAADRLLLVDKILRHEGEELAPGLLLEKLQPKEAVFNFKGYRYRVPY